MSDLLQIERLSIHYGELEAVRRISFSLACQETLGIAGPNMSGKSSLLAAIAGLPHRVTGSIRIVAADGRWEDITGLSAEERLRRHRIYCSPEASGVFPSLSVQENLLLTPRLLTLRTIVEDLERIYTTFPLLAERRRLPARFLSGGWRQILAVCRGQMVHPRLLLCDEPFLGLSPPMAALVLQTLSETTNPEGLPTSILLTDQNADRLRKAAGTLLSLDRGVLVQSATRSQLEGGSSQ